MPWRGDHFEPTTEQREAWKRRRCGSTQWVGYGMWPNSGPLKGQCVPCGTVTNWPVETPVTKPTESEKFQDRV